MNIQQTEASPAVRGQRRTGVVCLVLGSVTLLFGLYRAIPFFIGSTSGASSDSSFGILSLIVLTLLVGHGSRRSITSSAPPVPSSARTLGLVFAYITLAGLLAYAALGIGLSAAFDFMRRYD